MMVVAAIIGILSTVIVVSFSRGRVDVTQGTSLTKATVRLAQARTVASTVLGTYIPCGYGITRINSTTLAVYAGPNAATTDCVAMNKNYQPARDTIIYSQLFQNPRIEFKNSFSDVFFLPPDPKTYINNSGTVSNTPLEIIIGVVGTACPTNCKSVYVYPSGKIDSN